jgi:hypothetical protein
MGASPLKSMMPGVNTPQGGSANNDLSFHSQISTNAGNISRMQLYIDDPDGSKHNRIYRDL